MFFVDLLFLSIYVKNLYIIHNERTIKINVRWFDIRGFGDKQRNQKYDTYSKIVAYLRISPFTFEQLWKVSGINRNVLKTRLDELIEQRIVLKHTYKIPYKVEFYGHIDKNPVDYMHPLYNRDYYLLTHNNGYFKYQEFIKSFFLTRDPKPFFDKINKKEIESKNQLLFFSYINKYFENLGEIVKKPDSLSTNAVDIMTKIKNLNLNKLYHSDFILLVNRTNKLMIWLTRYQRELELLAINEKAYLNLLPFNNTLKGTKRIAKCLEYFSNRYQFSNADIIIRCSTDCCWLNINNSSVFLPMSDYESLLCYFFDIGRDLP